MVITFSDELHISFSLGIGSSCFYDFLTRNSGFRCCCFQSKKLVLTAFINFSRETLVSIVVAFSLRCVSYFECALTQTTTPPSSRDGLPERRLCGYASVVTRCGRQPFRGWYIQCNKTTRMHAVTISLGILRRREFVVSNQKHTCTEHQRRR